MSTRERRPRRVVPWGMLLFVPCVFAATPEEDALAASLSGRAAEAVAALARSEEPETRQAAALLALRANLPAARLIPADGPPWTEWARVELRMRQGALAEAATLALARMDAALAGEHRTVLVDEVVAWAEERAKTDPAGAAELLEAAVRVAGPAGESPASPAGFARSRAALLALPLEAPSDAAWRMAAALNGVFPPDETRLDVARVVGLRLVSHDPRKAVPLLVEALGGEPAGAMVAARALARMRGAPAEVEGALSSLAARVQEPEIARLRLAYALAAVAADPARGLAALDRLADDPIVGVEARTAAAERDPDPARRAARWGAMADESSAFGRRAMEARLVAIRAEVEAISDPEARRARARAALAEPGMADPTLLYAAAPEEGRTEALRDLARRFPKGPWCAELAEREVRAGADLPLAQAWTRACTAEDGWGHALAALAAGEPWLTLIPTEGGVEAIVAGVTTLSVAQHGVEPEKLFAAGENSPLDTPLDAFLVAPDRAWTVDASPDRAAVVRISPRGTGPIAALTVRAANLRATVLTTRRALRVVGVRVSDELALGVLSGDRPVPGATLRVRNEDGERTVRTGADGIVRLSRLEGFARVMATGEGAVGFTTFDASPVPAGDNARVEVLVWESGIPPGGARGHVSVFAPTVDGAAPPAAVTLVSRDVRGGEIERASVPLDRGAGSTELWMAPGGRIEALDATLVRGSAATPAAGGTESPVAFSVKGDPRKLLRVDVWPRVPLPPEGLGVTIEVETPWSKTSREVWIDQPGGVPAHVPLGAAAAGDHVRVSAKVRGRGTVSIDLVVPPEAETPHTAEFPRVTVPALDLAVLHRDHIERAWFVRPGTSLGEGVAAGDSPAWVVTSQGAARIAPRPALDLTVSGTLARGQAANLTFSALPAGSRLWAWVTDGSDFSSVPGGIGLPGGWSGSPGSTAMLAERSPVDGEVLAAGLLAEEERLREAAAPSRLDFGFSPGAERAMGLGGRGGGLGGGGTGEGMGGLGTRGRGAGSSVRGGTSPASDPGVLARLDGAARTEWAVTVPTWITRAWVRAVARTPDGRWVAARVAVPVEGGPVEGKPAAERHEGSLLAQALNLPLDGRIVALAGLARAGVAGARPALLAADPSLLDGPEVALAARLTGDPWRSEPDGAALPDPRHAERARQALLLASTDPGRALVAARRLLATPGIDDGARAEAGLALWAAHAPEAEVRAALTGEGTLTTLARDVATEPDPAHAARWRAIAENEHADPVVRGEAVVALAGVEGARSHGSSGGGRGRETPREGGRTAPTGSGSGGAFGADSSTSGSRGGVRASPGQGGSGDAEGGGGSASSVGTPGGAVPSAGGGRSASSAGTSAGAPPSAGRGGPASSAGTSAGAPPSAGHGGSGSSAGTAGAAGGAGALPSTGGGGSATSAGTSAGATPSGTVRTTGDGGSLSSAGSVGGSASSAGSARTTGDGGSGSSVGTVQAAGGGSATSVGTAAGDGVAGSSVRTAAGGGSGSSVRTAAGDGGSGSSVGTSTEAIPSTGGGGSATSVGTARTTGDGGSSAAAGPSRTTRTTGDGGSASSAGSSAAGLPQRAHAQVTTVPSTPKAADSTSPGAPDGASPGVPRLGLTVEPALAAWGGEVFTRGGKLAEDSSREVYAGQSVPLLIEVPARTSWTRLECPGGERLLFPTVKARSERCTVRAGAPGATRWEVREYAAEGQLLAEAAVELEVREGAPPLRPATRLERYALGMAVLGQRPAEGTALLEGLLADPDLDPTSVVSVAERLLQGAIVREDPVRISAAVARYQELVPEGELSLGTAAAVARAFARQGEYTRAVAAAKVVADARFREELAAVAVIRGAGLDLTALKLLRELTFRYPETATVTQVRAAAPTLLLERADGDGDRLGYTRSSLRHTAVAELARFLVLHPDDPAAPESAALLVEALTRLNDPARAQRLVPGLARRYADSSVGWRLAVAAADGELAAGQPAAALRRLKGVEGSREMVELRRGRALEALGRRAEARIAYSTSRTSEALARLDWLGPRWLTLEPLLVDAAVVPGELHPGTRVRISATKLELESLVLRDDGRLDLNRVRLDGLPTALERTVTVNASGDLPIPRLERGAWLLSPELGGGRTRTILLSGALEVRLQPGGDGTLVEILQADGRPVAGASVWAFGGGETAALRTDREGRAWVPRAVTSVLARAGGAYGWRDLGEGEVHAVAPVGVEEPRFTPSDPAVLRQATAATVRAAGL